MKIKKQVLAIVGSSSINSSNLKLLKKVEEFTSELYDFIFFKITELPHFNPDLDTESPPKQVVEFRELIIQSDGIIICTPEYVFSLPGTLKNAIEWCVFTTVFSQKPIGLITASASGVKAHEELQLLMKTLETKFTEGATLLIPGIKSKFNVQGELTDTEIIESLHRFIRVFDQQMNEG